MPLVRHTRYSDRPAALNSFPRHSPSVISRDGKGSSPHPGASLSLTKKHRAFRQGRNQASSPFASLYRSLHSAEEEIEISLGDPLVAFQSRVNHFLSHRRSRPALRHVYVQSNTPSEIIYSGLFGEERSVASELCQVLISYVALSDALFLFSLVGFPANRAKSIEISTSAHRG